MLDYYFYVIANKVCMEAVKSLSNSLIDLFNTFCPCCVQKNSIKGVLLQLNENRHPKQLDVNPHLV